MNTLIATALAPGATIGIVSPASPYNRYSDVERGIAWWESHKYHVKLAEGALESTNYVAGPPKRSASDLMAMFADPDVDAVQCLRGGYGSAEIIPHIDFQVIADNTKPFIGFSDITALHTAIHRFTVLATFYGPSLIGRMSKFTEQRLLAVLGGETTGLFPRNPNDSYVQTLAPGKASSRLIGGCLSDLMHTMGTPWELDLDGAIFAFEEVGSSPHGIDRALLQLTQAGKLEALQGAVVGDLVGYEWNGEGGSPWVHTKVLEGVLTERFRSLGVPVIYGLPFGHGDHLATLPLGVLAILDADAGSLSWLLSLRSSSRPEAHDIMAQTDVLGQIVILNGVPRSGKSSIVGMIQETFVGPWINLGVDTFKEHVAPERYSPAIGLRPGGERSDLEPLIVLLYAALYESIASHSRLGLSVVVNVGHHDAYAVPRGILVDSARRLNGLPVLLVEVRCPIEVIWERRRNTWLKEEEIPADAPVPDAVHRWQREVHQPGNL